MFNTVGIEAIICTVTRGSYKFQDTFFKYIQTFWILKRLFHLIITEGKKEFWKKLCLKIKKEYLSRRSCAMRGGLKW